MRDEEKVPFLTGGLIVHENCAIAIHTMRKNRMRSEHKDRYLKQLEEQCMHDCGRETIPTRSRARSPQARGNEPAPHFAA